MRDKRTRIFNRRKLSNRISRRSSRRSRKKRKTVIEFFLLLLLLGQLCRSLELNDFKVRRVQMFRKNLIELTELQIKHAKVKSTDLSGVVSSIRKFFLCLTRLKFKQSKVSYNKAKSSEKCLCLSLYYFFKHSFSMICDSRTLIAFRPSWVHASLSFSLSLWWHFTLSLSLFCIYPSISYFYFGYPMNIRSFLISRFRVYWCKEGAVFHGYSASCFRLVVGVASHWWDDGFD